MAFEKIDLNSREWEASASESNNAANASIKKIRQRFNFVRTYKELRARRSVIGISSAGADDGEAS